VKLMMILLDPLGRCCSANPALRELAVVALECHEGPLDAAHLTAAIHNRLDSLLPRPPPDHAELQSQQVRSKRSSCPCTCPVPQLLCEVCPL
jgi:hypothetical protein